MNNQNQEILCEIRRENLLMLASIGLNNIYFSVRYYNLIDLIVLLGYIHIMALKMFHICCLISYIWIWKGDWEKQLFCNFTEKNGFNYAAEGST